MCPFIVWVAASEEFSQYFTEAVPCQSKSERCNEMFLEIGLQISIVEASKTNNTGELIACSPS